MTDGANDVLWLDDDGELRQIPAYKVDVVDTPSAFADTALANSFPNSVQIRLPAPHVAYGSRPSDASHRAIVEELDYESLTLAQLRARLQSLSVADLEALLAYEETSKARAPFQTLLANRITRASAK